MQKNRIALLIDAENANSSAIEQILKEVGKSGTITVKRIYADWTDERNKKWKEQLNSYAIRPIQKFAYTKGKGSSDTALIIDAMDLLHFKTVDAFCIVSSDSDYTGLAHRIREDGLDIIGVGKSHTPEAFKKACTQFVREENLVKISDIQNNKKNVDKSIDYSLINSAFEMVEDDDNGMALLSKFSEALRKINSEFDPRSYGYTRFTTFCKNLKGYELYSHSDGTTISLKRKENEKQLIKTIPSNNGISSNIDYEKIKKAFDMVADNDSALLSKFAEALTKIKFQYKSYGYKRFFDFCNDLDGYEINLHDDGQTFSIKPKQ